jgi:hypothetical protein
MANRGNLALLENDFTAARYWFESALKVQGDQGTALKGIERLESQGL